MLNLAGDLVAYRSRCALVLVEKPLPYLIAVAPEGGRKSRLSVRLGYQCRKVLAPSFCGFAHGSKSSLRRLSERLACGLTLMLDTSSIDRAMKLIELISDMKRRNELAAELGKSPDYLWQVAVGWNGKRASPELAKEIERATGGKVKKASLRPDLWSPAAIRGVRP